MYGCGAVDEDKSYMAVDASYEAGPEDYDKSPSSHLRVNATLIITPANLFWQCIRTASFPELNCM